jgi:hypothetical protein
MFPVGRLAKGAGLKRFPILLSPIVGVEGSGARTAFATVVSVPDRVDDRDRQATDRCPAASPGNLLLCSASRDATAAL